MIIKQVVQTVTMASPDVELCGHKNKITHYSYYIVCSLPIMAVTKTCWPKDTHDVADLHTVSYKQDP